MKALVIVLLLGIAAHSAVAAPLGPLIDDTITRRIRSYLAHNLASITPITATLLPIAVEPRYPPPPVLRAKSYYWGDCGGGRATNDTFEPRLTKLPADPTLILADGYLKCRLIKATTFEARVPIALYPDGYFGDLEYEGRLISDRVELSTEAELKQLFELLVRAAKEPDDWEMEFYVENGLEPKLSDFRNESCFIPELLFEFVGETVVRIEINLTTERLLIQAGDRWECYTLDWRCATALSKIIGTEQTRLRQTPD